MRDGEPISRALEAALDSGDAGALALAEGQMKHALEAAAAAFDRPAVSALCRELIGLVRRSDTPFPEGTARAVLRTLRARRYFDLMQRVGDELIQAGQRAPQVRRQYAQALLDGGIITGALETLQALVADTAADPAEHAEARGLIGRAWKQLYVNAAGAPTRRRGEQLGRAFHAYHEVYREAPDRHLWHGINAVALLARARRDGVAVPGAPDDRALAREILGRLDAWRESDRLGMWDYATAVEACVALDRTPEALRWLVAYVRHPGADAFELASTHRQLIEVWQLDVAREPGASLLPVLRAELLRREGGEVEVAPDQLRPGAPALERILGTDSPVPLRWYLNGLDRCQAVTRVETVSEEPVGTGFFMPGRALHPSLGDELLLLTNAHVIGGDPPAANALRADEAVINLEVRGALAGAPERRRVAAVVFSSPPEALDVTVVRLDEPVTGILPYPVARALPRADGKQRVYIIGHPAGRTLSLSLNDNLFLDREDPRLHYRTPTEGGSSGSPVFNQQWELIGIHHAGGAAMRRLNGQAGTYAANEGIWIGAIARALAGHLG